MNRSKSDDTGGTTDLKTFNAQGWNTVKEPGSYVCNDTGRLLRVPTEAVKNQAHPIIEYFGPKGPSAVTRLSEDPRLAIPALRTLAGTAKIKPQF
ncbi:MAG: hypothetical protein P1V36_06455 [Planctomycetota bacterium]|nr:hypothetical protein [Planctomycetota bacterium]